MGSTAKDNGKEKKQEPEKNDPQPVYKFRVSNVDEKLKETILEIHSKHKNASSLPAMVEGIKKDLDNKISRGWIVFAGKHMSGACSYIQNTMLDFECDGTAFVIFQTFCPE